MLEMHPTGRTPVQLLLVEDMAADVRLTREVLRETGIPHVLHVAHDGDKAMGMIRDSSLYGGAAHPDLVLLDLNLPGRSGREVLSEIKKDPQLRRIPVVVLSTSTAEADIVSCYDAHANCYVTKPVELDEFFEFARSLRDFWLRHAVLPTRLQSVISG